MGEGTEMTCGEEFQNVPLQGQAKKIKIVSNNCCYGPGPAIGEEIEQHITIMADGRVWFSGYQYSEPFEKMNRVRQKQFKITKEKADVIMSVFTKFFSSEFQYVMATDIGDWTMRITNDAGRTFQFYGSLCADYEVEGRNLSDLIRDNLEMEDLFVFDGNDRPEPIERIVIEYHRITKMKPKRPVSKNIDIVTWDYSERLTIDRKTNTLEYVQRIGSGCVVTRTYEVQEGIAALLDDLDADSLFDSVEGNPLDVVENPNETKDYRITIHFKKSTERIIEGTFDKKGLPEDWAEFAESIEEFLQFYGIGEIINPRVYSKVRRCKGDYIYCSVEFEHGGKTYYYRTEDESIEIGDRVLVAVGNEMLKKEVTVKNIEYFGEGALPLPLEKTKMIIGKAER